MFEYIVVALVIGALSYILAPKPPKPEPHSLDQFDVPVVDAGKEIVVVFGDVWLKDPNVVWYGDLANTKIKGDSAKK